MRTRRYEGAAHARRGNEHYAASGNVDAEAALVAVDVEKYYGTKSNVTKALDGIGFAVGRGEYIGVMGASGSGKTTLLNCISTIDTVSAGHILIDGVDVTTMGRKELSRFRRERLGFVFQDFNLLDTLTCYENIALALTILRVAPPETDRRVQEVARTLGIPDILDKYPYQVSGGQKQRVACARAIVTRPTLVLADEPTGALDSKSARALLESFRALVHERDATILMVTHDAFSASHCDRILFIRDGRIFHEVVRGNDSRRQLFDRILEVVTLLGGDSREVV
ncbi:MAG: ABC transporter ATP-binding protein [Coriobacteriales bacterium]|jgi:putative ABC transport system ATP-binding protein|nr:ABC transporter ATP-binding protein [Coriobacteriales bacterium]